MSTFIRLFLASLIALYFEMLVIRYLPTEIRIFTNLKNLPLVASFLGLGLGILLGRPTRQLRQWFPIVSLVLFVLIRFATFLHLPKVDLSWSYRLAYSPGFWPRLFSALRFVTITLGITGLIVILFVAFGGFIGEQLKRMPSLPGYGTNLMGSLAGIALFCALSALNLGPAIWLLVGFCLLVVFFVREPAAILLFVLTITLVAIPEPNTLWSPYYRIDFTQLPAPAGDTSVSAYSIVTNHVWYQWMADLSPGFLNRYPDAVPNRYLIPYYDLPYRLVPNPKNVLILGAGTGNDVAAALRHGAQHVDAVELDPVILRLGREYHPERPYSSTKVAAYVDDARDFVSRTKTKYDLVVFAFLDSSTLLSGFSSLRLDNYVYTVQSFEDTKRLMAKNGTLVLSFATSRSFPTDRLYATMERAFDAPPAAYLTSYWVNGVLLVEGGAHDNRIPELPNVTQELESRRNVTELATDKWPFLYLEKHAIPGSILVIGSIFLLGAWVLLRKMDVLAWKHSSVSWHFFFLGAGFMLLETKAVTQLSLLFGSTWVVNSIAIGSFILMAVISNLAVSVWNLSPVASYGILFCLLVADAQFPYSRLDGVSTALRLTVGGTWVALPILFSGIIFSRGIKKLPDAAQVVGINLFGAVCGGLLENSVMVGGTPVLIWLAITLYACSAAAAELNPGLRQKEISAND